jgi:hypothetical protein
MDMELSKIEVTDSRTLEDWQGSAAVVTTGGLDDVCRLSDKGLPDSSSVWKNFYVGDIFSISKFIESEFELGPWHFSDLTTDDRHSIAHERTRKAEKEHTEYAHALLEENQRLLVQLHLMDVETTPFLSAAGELVYSRLIDALRDGNDGALLEQLAPGSRLEELLEEARNIGISPRVAVLAPEMGKAFYDSLLEADTKNDDSAFERLLKLWKRAEELGIGIDKWRLQNVVWHMLEVKTSAPSAALLQFAGELGFALPGM